MLWRHDSPRPDSFQPAGVLISWRQDLFTAIHFIIAVALDCRQPLENSGVGNLHLQRQGLASCPWQHFLRLPLISEHFPLESVEKKAYREWHVSSKGSGAGRADGRSQSWHTVLDWSQTTVTVLPYKDRRYRTEACRSLLLADQYFPSLCMNSHREKSIMTFMKGNAIYM